MLIGSSQIETTVKAGRFNCPNCKTPENYEVKNVRTYWHLMFVPLFPEGNHGETLSCTFCNTPYPMAAIAEYGIPGAESYMEPEPPAFSRRLGAYAIDYLFINVLLLTTVFAFSGFEFSIPGMMGAAFAYFLLCDLALNGSSPGKKIHGLKVAKAKDNNLPKLPQLLIRNAIKGICFLYYISPIYIFANFNEQKQALHDKIAGTKIIETTVT